MSGVAAVCRRGDEKVLSQHGDKGVRMANVVKSAWFGRQVTVMLVTEKAVTGELIEVSEHYVVLNTKVGEKQIMVHAIIAVWPADQSSEA